MFISYTKSGEKTEDGRLKFAIHKDLKRQGKYICGKLSSKKKFNYFETKMYMNNKLAYPEEGGTKIY